MSGSDVLPFSPSEGSLRALLAGTSEADELLPRFEQLPPTGRENRRLHYTGLAVAGIAAVLLVLYAAPSLFVGSLRTAGEHDRQKLYTEFGPLPAAEQPSTVPPYVPPPMPTVRPYVPPPMPAVPLYVPPQMPTMPPYVYVLPPMPTIPPYVPPEWPSVPPYVLPWSPVEPVAVKRAAKERGTLSVKKMTTDSTTPSPTTTTVDNGPRRGSFLVIGDWGWDESLHGNVPNTSCQRAIADRMLEKFKELGDVRFIINVGDSFYPEGLTGKDDPQWDTKWRNIYAPELRSVPWYSVYGNHDYHHDPCACSTDPINCAQVNYDISDKSRFYMPGFNYYVEHSDLQLEVIGLDMNKLMDGWNNTATADELRFTDCQWTKCPDMCYGNTDARTAQAFDLYWQRRNATKAKNLLVFSHYPTDYFQAVPSFLADLSSATRTPLVYFGGHRHSTDDWSTWQIYPNKNWLVGGGGGWSCDSWAQGIVVGEITHGFKVKTYTALVDPDICCPKGR